jgi:hypothetical protein
MVPRPMPAATFVVRRRYLLVVPRPSPAVPLVFAAHCASYVFDRGAQAGAQTAACGNAAPSHQESNIRQMSRGAE